MSGLGENLSELKMRIQNAHDELNKMGVPDQPLPEMINMTNLLRSNEYLTKTDEKKTVLIHAYEVYTKQLEQIVESLLSIQSDLRDIVRTEASIIGSKRESSKKTTKIRKKPQKTKTRK